MVVHLAMSIALGMALAVPVTAIGGWATTTAGGVLAGMAFGLIVWLVMQYLVWDAIDPAAAERFTPWVFAIGHLMYGWSPAWPSPAPAAAWARSEPPADSASLTGRTVLHALIRGLRCPGGLVDHARQLGHRGKR
jgi:hypothetical protein